MTNPITKLRAVLGRRRKTSTRDSENATAVEDYLVEVRVPPEDGAVPVTVGFTLAELLEIHTLAELRERAADKAGQARRGNSPSVGAKPDPADFKDKPIGDLLDALGVPEEPDRYEEQGGSTALRFNLGRTLRARATDATPKPADDSGKRAP